jgi:K+-sensing histidine kinase KdpD
LANNGVGLGLSIIKTICKQMLWELRLETIQDAGTTATIVLSCPIKKAPTSEKKIAIIRETPPELPVLLETP